MLASSRIIAAITLIAFALTFAVPAGAKCYPIDKAPLDADCVVMPHGSQRGVWFRLDKADELRRLNLIIPELRGQVGRYEELMKLRDSQLTDLRGALGAHKRAGELLKTTNATLVKDARRARDERDKAQAALGAWYRSPFLWFGVGTLVSIVVGGLVFGLASK